MKNLSRFAMFCFAVVLSGTLSAQQVYDWVSKMQDPNANFFDVQATFNAYKNDYISTYRAANGSDPVKIPGYKQYKRWEWFHAPRVSATGERFNPAAVWMEMQNYRQQTGGFQAGNWTFVGPQTTPSGGGNGRCNFIRVDPTNSNILWTGSPSGGLWKSTNGGQNWTTNTDQLPFVIGCTDVAIDPANTQIMYLATGDGDAGDNYSVGLLKSTDGGQTWNTTGLTFVTSQIRMMSKVMIHPTNSNILLVATSGGIYRSTDAGATWNVSTTGSFKDMEFKPGDPNTVYACGNQFYRSTDNGVTWNLITGNPLPTAANCSRMAIAVTEADPTKVYIIAGLPAPNYGTEGFYYSTNSGASFTQPSTPNIGNQQWYDLCIDGSPTNASEIVIGGQTQFLRSTNNGTSWSSNGAGTHVDYHDIVFVSGTSYYMACDGGVYVTTNSGGSWTDLGNDLAISQMYGFGQSATTANLLLTGWQDNGTNRYNGSWAEVMGGDGMLCFISQFNNNNMWGSQYDGSLNRSTNGGTSWSGANTGITETGAWVTPWKESPTTGSTLYAGFVNMWRSTNGGQSWTVMGNIPGSSTISAIAIAPSNTQVVWAAKGGTLYKTTNGGGSWTAITSLPGGSISYIACHNTDANKVWVTFSGFTNTLKVLKTTDQGTTWTNMSGGLPNIPINCITYHNGTNDGVYIGTDAGVYYIDGTMSVWQPFSGGLPNVVVTQIEIYYAGNKLRASTYGRGVWESSFYTPGSEAPIANFSANKLIDCPGTAIQFTDYSPFLPTSWNWSFPGGSPASFNGQNPPLVYYNTPGTYAVTLTVSNSNGTDTETKTNYITIASSTNPNPTTVGDSVCSPGGIVNLTASGSGGTLRWWDAPGGGNQVNTGPTYNPNITATTTWYVDETFPNGSVGTVGPMNNTMGAGAMFVANDIRGQYFDVLSPIILNTVAVYSNSAGNRTIEILDGNGNLYKDTTVYIPASPSTPTAVILDIPIYPGNNYFIKCRGLVDLYRNSSGAVYPYTSASVNITNSNAGSPGYYYFFYDWNYTNIVCNTGRTPVTGTVYTCSSVEELFAAGSFQLFPNPSQGQFELTFETLVKDDYTIRIYNSIGQVVFEEKAADFAGNYHQRINISGHGKGIYMLEVSNGKADAFKKVITY